MAEIPTSGKDDRESIRDVVKTDEYTPRPIGYLDRDLELVAPGNYYTKSTRQVERYPFTLNPQTNSALNTARLPSNSELKGMQLAYREQTFSEDLLRRNAARQLFVFLLMGIAAPILASMVFAFGMWSFGAVTYFLVPIVLLLGFTQAYQVVVNQEMNVRKAASWIFVPLMVVLGLFVAGMFMSSGYMLATVFVLAALVVFAREGLAPFEFYGQWLLAHPRLRPQTRRLTRLSIATFSRRAALVSLLAVFLIVPPVVSYFVSEEPHQFTAVILLGLVALWLLVMLAPQAVSTVGMLTPRFLVPAAKTTFRSWKWGIPAAALLLLIVLTLFYGHSVLHRQHHEYFAMVIVLGVLPLLALSPLAWAIERVASRLFPGLFSKESGRPGLLESLRTFKDVMAIYMTYGGASLQGPGAWIPGTPVRARIKTFRMLVIVVPLALTMTLAGWAPWVLGRDFTRVLASVGEQGTASEVIGTMVEESPWGSKDWKRYQSLSGLPRDSYGNVDSRFAENERVMRRRRANAALHFKNAIAESPSIWLVIAFLGTVIRGDPQCLAFIVAAVFTAVFMSLLTFFSLYAHPIAVICKARREIDALDQDDRPQWQWYVDRLRGSPHAAYDPIMPSRPNAPPQDESPGVILEKNHFFLGTDPYADFPILLDKKILSEHVYIVGETGSGKTSMGIMPLLMQLIPDPTPDSELSDETRGVRKLRRQLREEGQDGDLFPVAQKQTPSVTREGWDRAVAELDKEHNPIVIIDLKGDPALFHGARLRALRQDQPFRFFATQKGRPTHYFNPFQINDPERRSVVQVCEIFLDSLSLSHGEGYGRSYFSRRSREELYDIISDKDNPPQTFEQLYEKLDGRRQDRQVKGDQDKDTFELVATIHTLANYPQLNTVEDTVPRNQSINMDRLLEERQVSYFWLPAAVESISVREIGKLALYCLLTAAIQRQTDGKPKRQAYLFIDEFQRIAGRNFQVIIEQARSFGIGLVLANQSISDLKTPDVDLRPTINTNTRLKQYFTVTDPTEMHELSNTSGQELFLTTAWSDQPEMYTPGNRGPITMFRKDKPVLVRSRTHAEQLKNRITINDVFSVNDDPRDSILSISRGSGYTQFGGLPIVLRSMWPLHYEQYVRLASEPWPMVPVQEKATKKAVKATLKPQDITEPKIPVLVNEKTDMQIERGRRARLVELMRKRIVRTSEQIAIKTRQPAPPKSKGQMSP